MKDEKFIALKKEYGDKIFRRRTLEDLLQKEDFDPWQKDIIKQEIDELNIEESQQKIIDYVKTQDDIQINNKENQELNNQRKDHIENLLSNYL